LNSDFKNQTLKRITFDTKILMFKKVYNHSLDN